MKVRSAKALVREFRLVLYEYNASIVSESIFKYPNEPTSQWYQKQGAEI